MTPAIRVENLSKCYRIGHAARRGSYRTLRESLMDGASSAIRRLKGGSADGTTEEFWALKGVDFEVQSGEVVGVIGRNGAGKSTLLKILSRITEPTEGRVRIRGRVGSLLEVGTGFHPELSGRENIYLNGAILGMSRREIARNFDEIVAFAEVERFLDTPVKRYSSGMYVRLAFAVAAFLQPEILIVDEVLSVGDASFQKKCLGKMGDVSRSGRTILFVSHNMAAIEALCDRCLLLSSGEVVSDATTDLVLADYSRLGNQSASCQVDLTAHPGRSSTSRIVMRRVTTRHNSDEPVCSVRMDEGLSVDVEYDARGERPNVVLGIVIKTVTGAALFGVNNRFIPGFDFRKAPGSGAVSCRMPRLPLMPGLYTIDLYFGDEVRDIDVVEDAIQIEVTESDVFGSGKLPPHAAGPIYWPATWIVQGLQTA